MAQKITQKPAYTLSGKIVYGQGIGKLVGTPTANLQILSKDTMPPVGVYVTEVLLEGQIYYGVTNIGTSPTVNKNKEISIETMILNFCKDIHGQQMESGFWRPSYRPSGTPCGFRPPLRRYPHPCRNRSGTYKTRRFYRSRRCMSDSKRNSAGQFYRGCHAGNPAPY